MIRRRYDYTYLTALENGSFDYCTTLICHEIDSDSHRLVVDNCCGPWVSRQMAARSHDYVAFFELSNGRFTPTVLRASSFGLNFMGEI